MKSSLPGVKILQGNKLVKVFKFSLLNHLSGDIMHIWMYGLQLKMRC